MRHKRHLTDQQWKILDPVPEPARRRDGRGRPWKERRAVLNGILWVLRTGAPWVELPDRYPSYQTCHRRFQQWVQSGVMRGILEALAAELKIHGLIDVEEALHRWEFRTIEKRAPRSGKQSEVRDRKSWLWQTGMVSPLPSVLLTFKMFSVCKDFFMASMRPRLLVELSRA